MHEALKRRILTVEFAFATGIVGRVERAETAGRSGTAKGSVTSEQMIEAVSDVEGGSVSDANKTVFDGTDSSSSRCGSAIELSGLELFLLGLTSPIHNANYFQTN